MLVEMERKALGAVEQADPIFLQVHDVAAPEPVDERAHALEVGGADRALLGQRLLDLVGRGLELGGRIIEQRARAP